MGPLTFSGPVQQGLRLLERRGGIHVYRIRVRPLQLPLRLDMELPCNISVRQASERELLAATHDPELRMTEQFVADALERGDRAFAAFDGEAMVAYTWRSTTTAPLVEGLGISVDAPYVYAYKTLTRRSHRGMRLYLALVAASGPPYIALGYTHLASYVAPYNRAVLGFEAENGFRKIGYAGYLEWFGRTIPFTTPAVARIGFRIVTNRSYPGTVTTTG